MALKGGKLMFVYGIRYIVKIRTVDQYVRRQAEEFLVESYFDGAAVRVVDFALIKE